MIQNILLFARKSKKVVFNNQIVIIEIKKKHSKDTTKKIKSQKTDETN